MGKRKTQFPPPSFPRQQPTRSAKGKLPGQEHSVAGLRALPKNTAKSSEWPNLLASATARIDRYVPNTENDEDRLLKDGLKALLEWLPEAGRQSLANDVSRCIADKAHWNVFHGLLTCLVVPTKASSDIELTSSPDREFAGILAKILGKHDEPIDAFQSDCLRRDDHRCVVSGLLDSDMWITRGYPEDEESTFVEAAHIIPYTYSNWANTNHRMYGESLSSIVFSVIEHMAKSSANHESSVPAGLSRKCLYSF